MLRKTNSLYSTIAPLLTTEAYERGPGDDGDEGKKGGWKKGKGRLPPEEQEMEKVNLKKVPGKKKTGKCNKS